MGDHIPLATPGAELTRLKPGPVTFLDLVFELGIEGGRRHLGSLRAGRVW